MLIINILNKTNTRLVQPIRCLIHSNIRLKHSTARLIFLNGRLNEPNTRLKYPTARLIFLSGRLIKANTRLKHSTARLIFLSGRLIKPNTCLEFPHGSFIQSNGRLVYSISANRSFVSRKPKIFQTFSEFNF
jgi:hypothetical protein